MIAEDLYGFDFLRPRANPSPNVPVGAHSVGHYRIRPPFVSTYKKMSYVQLFWCVRGSGTIEFHGVSRTLRAGQIALYFSGMMHNWSATERPWDFWWAALDGPLAEPLIVGLGLQADIYEAGPAPAGLFKRLEKVIRIPSKSCEMESASLALQILFLAAERHQDQSDPLARQVMERIHNGWASPHINVNTLAEEFRIHRSILTRRFQHLAGMSPVHYINRIRMQNVLLFLQQTSLTVRDIAVRCGYRDAGYVARLTRHMTGLSPSRYRAMHKSQPEQGALPST